MGSGFKGSELKGSEHNDEFISTKNAISTKTNNSGGIQGGISNGELINLNIAFKPTATIGSKQNTINKDNQVITLEANGRHDPCVVPRAIPIVEAMAALVLADFILIQRTTQL